MKTIISLLSLATLTTAHFVLQIPTSLGFDDEAEGEGPCGSFSATDRSTGVTEWPIGGGAIGLLTTHTHVTYDISAALLSDVTTWTPLMPQIDQRGVGSFCLPSVPGNAAWVGQDAVLQVVQTGPDGTLFQCAAIKFVAGGARGTPSDCSNSTGVTAAIIGNPISSSLTSTPVALPTSTTSALTTSTIASNLPVAPTTAASTTAIVSSLTASSLPGSASSSATKSSISSAVLGSSSSAVVTSKISSSATTSSNSTKATSTSAAQFTGGSSVLGSGSVFTLLSAVSLSMLLSL